MDSFFWAIIIYFSVNLIITLIWITIPGLIHMYRQKYGLPKRMIIWPLTVKMFNLYNHQNDLVFYTVIGTFGIIIGTIGYVLYRIIYKALRWCTLSVAFSKEEKVQIALGTIVKIVEPKDNNN